MGFYAQCRERKRGRISDAPTRKEANDRESKRTKIVKKKLDENWRDERAAVLFSRRE